MRGLPDSAPRENGVERGRSPVDGGARAHTMRDNTTRRGKYPDTTTDAQPATTAFDARERLEGTYDGTFHFQFRSAGMAHGFSAAAGGDDS